MAAFCDEHSHQDKNFSDLATHRECPIKWLKKMLIFQKSTGNILQRLHALGMI